VLHAGCARLLSGCEDWRFTLTDPDNRRPWTSTALLKRLTHTFSCPAVRSRDLKLQYAPRCCTFAPITIGLLREAELPAVARPRRQGDVGGRLRAARGRAREWSWLCHDFTDRSAASAHPLDAAFLGDTEVRLPSSDGRWSNLLAGRSWSSMRMVSGLGMMTVDDLARAISRAAQARTYPLAVRRRNPRSTSVVSTDDSRLDIDANQARGLLGGKDAARASPETQPSSAPLGTEFLGSWNSLVRDWAYPVPLCRFHAYE
jgi:hypothetical protein